MHETNSSPLKINGWKMNFLFLMARFLEAMLVSGSVVIAQLVCWISGASSRISLVEWWLQMVVDIQLDEWARC